MQPKSERPLSEGQRIHHELKHQEELCTCQRQFRINKIGEGKYCVSVHGDMYHMFHGLSNVSYSDTLAILGLRSLWVPRLYQDLNCSISVWLFRIVLNFLVSPK